MNDYNQKYQDSLFDLIKSQESTKKDASVRGNYFDNSNNDDSSERKEYPVKITTFTKIKYV